MIKRYPAIEFVSRWGRPGALISSVLVGLVTVICSLQAGNMVGSVASVIGAVVLWGVLRVGAELIEVISETLLPQ